MRVTLDININIYDCNIKMYYSFHHLNHPLHLFIDIAFSSFLNYGGVCTQWTKDFNTKTSHGYSIDLLMENKGVNFHAGIGIGQVIDSPLQVFLKAGFAAII